MRLAMRGLRTGLLKSILMAPREKIKLKDAMCQALCDCNSTQGIIHLPVRSACNTCEGGEGGRAGQC